MNNIREKKSAILLSYVNIILSNGFGLIYTPILLNELGKKEFGVYSLCTSIIEYLAVVNMGYASAYIRFHAKYSAEDNQDKITKLNTTMLVIYFMLGIIVFIGGILASSNIGFIFGKNFSEDELLRASVIIFILSINLAISMPASVFNAMISTNEKFIFQRVSEMIKTVLIPLVSMIILFKGHKSVGISVGTLIVNLFVAAIQVYYCLNRIKIKFEYKRIDPNMLKSVLGFSAFLFLQSLIDCLNWQVDKLILARVSGSVEIAFYTIGSRINSMVMNFSIAIYTVFIPQIHKMVHKEANMEKVSILFARVGKIQFSVIAFIFIVILEWGNELIFYWVGNGYKKSYFVAILLLAPMIVQLSQSLAVEIVKAKNKQGFLNLIYLGICLINVGISIPLSKKYGSVGAALGSSISGIVAWGIIANIYFIRVIKIKMSYWIKEVAGILWGVVATIPVAIVFRINFDFSIFNILFCCFLQFIVYVVVIYKLGLSVVDKKIIKDKIRSKKIMLK